MSQLDFVLLVLDILNGVSILRITPVCEDDEVLGDAYENKSNEINGLTAMDRRLLCPWL